MKKVLVILTMIFLTACTQPKTEIIYKNVYPSLPQLESPLTLATSACKFSVPENDSKIVVGFDKDNLKCYLKNQEINREQKLLYEKFVKEINNERAKWNALNKS